ncbi:MAG: hypothetical protein ACRCYS_11100, partial [Beijerinckiaceae bacterium]
MAFFEGSMIPALDSDGNPISGAQWKFYRSGTTTPLAVYGEAALSTSLGSAVTAAADGAFVPIFYDNQTLTRARMETSGGALIRGYDIDPINADGINGTYVTPETFGAVGDGVTDDSQAFIDMSAAFATAGYGAVKLRTGATYIIGRQTENGGGYRYQGVDILSANGLSYFIVDMNGATLKMKGGLRFGGFDASNVPTTSISNGDIAQRADQGILIRAQNCGAVVILNGAVNGNCANGVVGGPWGDAGRQCIAYGLHIFECDQVLVDGVIAEDWLLDGFAVG